MRTLTFLFSDLRDYTGFVERQGDAAATELIRDYRTTVRAEVARVGGAEIKTEGDSFYVVFEAVSTAVECGMAILRAADAYSRLHRDAPMRVGVGVHSGEPRPHEGQFVGRAVIVAARLAQQAEAGELLVTETSRALLPPELAPAMRERAGLMLKGVSEPPRIFSLDRSAPAAFVTAPVSGRVVSPILVGREPESATLEESVGAAREGRGSLTLVAGEAGIGKTRLVTAAAGAAQRSGVRVVRVATFAGDADQPGALFLDLARSLERDRVEGHAERIRTALDTLAIDGDTARRRRGVVQGLADALVALARAAPLVLVIEDLHWTDELTLEVLARSARLVPELPVAIWATYRTDELAPASAMRRWRAELLAQRRAAELALRRLTRDETAAIAGAMFGAGAPVPADMVERLHSRSEGVPLVIEELFAVLGADEASATELPETLSQATLQRAERLSHCARDVAEAAAVIGRSFDLALLLRVGPFEAAYALEGIDELRDQHFVRAVASAAAFDFRHALIRDALYTAIPLARRAGLHARAAEALRDGGEGREAVLAQHLEAAGDVDGASAYALRAARSASALSSHREAAGLYARALRLLPRRAPAERAPILAEYGAELVAIDENAAAADVLAEGRRLYRSAGDAHAAAALVPPLVAARHLLGDDLDRRVALLDDAMHDIAHGPEDAARLRGRLLAGRAAAYMLDRQLEIAERDAVAALALARSGGDAATELNVMATLGTVLVFGGRGEDGWAMLEQAARRGAAAGSDSETARAYRMLGSCASVLVEYERGEQWLREGIAFAERSDMWNHRHYMAAHLAHVLWATGRLDEASAAAEQALADGRGGITTRITALYVIGYIRLVRGELDGARPPFEEALALAGSMRELQRTGPPLWGMAEVALRSGDIDRAISLCHQGRDASVRVADAAYLFPFLVTGTRALLATGDVAGARAWVDEVAAAVEARGIPGTLPAVAHAKGLLALAARRGGAGRELLAEAVTAWRVRGREWDAREAEADLAGGDPELRRAERWGPLTAREFEVAQLLAQGLTNAQIAERLVLAPRTIATHVEHILAKIGASRRAEVAAWIGRRSGPAG